MPFLTASLGGGDVRPLLLQRKTSLCLPSNASGRFVEKRCDILCNSTILTKRPFLPCFLLTNVLHYAWENNTSESLPGVLSMGSSGRIVPPGCHALFMPLEVNDWEKVETFRRGVPPEYGKREADQDWNRDFTMPCSETPSLRRSGMKRGWRAA